MRIAINGFGRIGRCFLRAQLEAAHYAALQVVAINEPADCATLAHLFKYDSTHGRFAGEVHCQDDALWVNRQKIAVSHHQQIRHLPWAELDVDCVLESSGAVLSTEAARQHLQQGARQVLLSHPGDQAVDNTTVYGYNHHHLRAQDEVISNASCTTNCIVPVIDVLHEALCIERGTITTIHSAMNDQPVLDAYHHTDLRKTRAAMHSVIPVETELAKGIERLMPDLQGKFTAQALRVPTINVSAMDLTVQVQKPVTAQGVNALLSTAGAERYAGVLAVSEEPLASCDFNHDTRSAIVDASQTRVSDSHLVKLLVWFDNEWAYANRLLDVLAYISQLRKDSL